MVLLFGSSLHSKKKKRKNPGNPSELDPLWQNFLGPRINEPTVLCPRTHLFFLSTRLISGLIKELVVKHMDVLLKIRFIFQDQLKHSDILISGHPHFCHG